MGETAWRLFFALCEREVKIGDSGLLVSETVTAAEILIRGPCQQSRRNPDAG